ncbi:hypothetical protein PInf_015285 [Phytophthora infestans]|nr:hypothetical protein PInf_015285 [Phytophthora infestans]
MPNVTSWTEVEVNILIQTWAEVEAKYPLLRCPRGSVTLHSKMYALYSKRCPFVRSSTAVNRMKNHMRIFILFVHKFDESSRQRGERLWFDYNPKERRANAPMRLRGLATTVNQKSYARLMTMERAQRWLVGSSEENQQGDDGMLRSETRLMPPVSAGRASIGDELSLSSEVSTPCTEQDCHILLENVMKLQDEKMRQAVSKLRADVADEVQRSSEMLLSIIRNQFEDAESSGDVAFVTKVLDMQTQQIQERFDQFQEKQTRQDAAHRALIGEHGKNRQNLHAKMYALYSQRIAYDKERLEDGGRLWFDLSFRERHQRRGLVPRRPRGLATSLNKEAYTKLLKMERAQRWLAGNSLAKMEEEHQETRGEQLKSSFISPVQPGLDSERRVGSFGVSNMGDFYPLPEAVVDQEDAMEEKSHSQVQDRSDTSTCSLYSEDEDSLRSSTPESLIRVQDTKEVKTDAGLRPSLKHRDCKLLLERMMAFQNRTKRRAVAKLRAGIESEIQRNSEMLLSIVSSQSEDPESRKDVAFLTKVLSMQRQQVQDRFDQFEAERIHEEALLKGDDEAN